MLRATFYFPEALQQRLKTASKRHKKSVSKYAQEALDKVLAEDERKQLKEMDAALQEVKGFIKDPVTDASLTVDEILYGENGAWRGTMPLTDP
jgi:predicted DNA-binding protein